LIENTLELGRQMRVDPNFSTTRTLLSGRHGCAKCGLLFRIRECWSLDLSSDSTTFKNWTFGKLLESTKLDIPDPRFVPSGAEGLFMPFVFVVTRRSPYQSMCYGHTTTNKLLSRVHIYIMSTFI
jgi:hypothetical protein